LKATKSEVFILLVGPEETTKPIQEQFKSTRSYKKTKSFVDAASAKNFLDVSKFPNNSIIILILVTPDFTKEEDLQKELDVVAQIKAEDPSMDIMLLTSESVSSSTVDFVVQRSSEAFGKIITNITWAIREQDRIRRQVESKQFIKMAIIVFFSLAHQCRTIPMSFGLFSIILLQRTSQIWRASLLNTVTFVKQHRSLNCKRF